MIKIFSPTDTDFTSNGDAIIKATRAVVKKVDNGDYYLELECGLEFVDYIKANNLVVVPTPQGEQAFRFESPIETTRTKIRAKAWHVYYDAENYVINDSYVVNKNCEDALNHLNAATDNPSPFNMSSDIDTLASFRCVRKSLREAIVTVMERWGGHIVRDNFNLALNTVIGQDNGVTIQYKKNLKDIVVSEDWSSVCTKILPVGFDGITLEELYLYSDVQYSIPYTKVISFEQDIDEADYPDEESYKQALREDLREQATEFLKLSQYPAINYTLSANVEKITDVGDIVQVYDERLGVNLTASVLSFEYDVILEKYTSIEFGTSSASLSDLMSTVSSEISTAITENNQNLIVNLQSAIEVVEGRIWSALGSSYCIFSGDEIIILDQLPAEDARNCIKIDSEGISISSTGINGVFTLVWSIEGSFNASAIDIINFTADMIKGGALKVGSNLNAFGKIEAYNESNNLIAEIDKSGVKMIGKDGSYLLVNPQVGIAGYDRLGNQTLIFDGDKLSVKKAVAEDELNICKKVKFIPINNGVGLFSV